MLYRYKSISFIDLISLLLICPNGNFSVSETVFVVLQKCSYLLTIYNYFSHVNGFKMSKKFK